MVRSLTFCLLLAVGCGSGSVDSGPAPAGALPFVEGGAEFHMSTGQGLDHQPMDVFVRGDGVVFWCVQTDIFRTDANGTKTVLHGAPQGTFGRIVADTDRVYFTSVCMVGSVPESGGTYATLSNIGGIWYTELALRGPYLFAVRNLGNFKEGSAIHRIDKLTGVTVALANWEPGTPCNLAVDETRVYWTNAYLGAGHDTIRSVSREGGTIETLVEGLEPPGGLAIENGRLYWTELSGRIRSVSSSGGLVTTIAEHLDFPESIVAKGDSIYWCERTGNLQRRRLSDGRTTTLLTGLPSPGRVALYGGVLYYTDETKNLLGAVSVDREVAAPPAPELRWAFETPMLYQNTHSYASVAELNGKIYCWGGFYIWGVRNYLEVYDTVSRTWSWGAPYPSTVAGAAVGVIGGKIYLAGGVHYEAGETFLKKAYVFDPAMQSYTPLPDLNEPRFAAASFVLDGKLYAMGGWGKDYHPLATTEVFDPAVGQWAHGPVMPLPTQTHAAVVLGGKVYVTGGTTPLLGGGATPWMYVWDPATDVWTQGPSMSIPRYGHAMAAVAGKLVVAGGWDGMVNRGSVEIFDPAANAWRLSTPLPFPCGEGNRAVAIGKRLYVLGTQGPDGNSVETPW